MTTRILFLIAFLAVNCHASLFSYTRAQRAQPYAIPAFAPLISENCEGAGTPAGWTNNGTVDWDKATSPPVGSQCLYLAAASANRTGYLLSAGYASVCVFMAVRMESPIFSGGSGNTIFQLEDVNGATVAKFAFGGSSGGFTAVNGTTVATEVTGYAGNTTYYIWLQYTKGSGANGISRVYISTTTTKPSTPTVQVTAGNATADARILEMRGNGACCPMRFDYIRLADYVLESATP